MLCKIKHTAINLKALTNPNIYPNIFVLDLSNIILPKSKGKTIVPKQQRRAEKVPSVIRINTWTLSLNLKNSDTKTNISTTKFEAKTHTKRVITLPLKNLQQMVPAISSPKCARKLLVMLRPRNEIVNYSLFL